MGLKPRLKSVNLPGKLRQIREGLNLSQNDILIRLGFDDIFDRSTISHYEKGEREPPLPVILKYARIANVSVESLIDDELNIPENFR